MFRDLYRARRNLLLNVVPLSEIVVLGRPCKRHMCLRKRSASCSVFVDSLQGMKCTILLYLSTTTRMESWPSDLGSFTMKSYARWVHGNASEGIWVVGIDLVFPFAH